MSKLITKRKPQIKKGSVSESAKNAKVLSGVVLNNYKALIRQVNEKYPKGLSQDQKLHIKELFLKNPHISFGEVNTALSFLASRGKGKKA